MNLTGDPRRWASDSAAAGVVHFWAPYLYRSRFYAETEEQECARALEHLETTIAFEGPRHRRRDHPGDDPGDGRDHDPAARLPRRRP